MKNLSEYIQKYPHRTTAILGVNIEQLGQLIEALKTHDAERLKVEGSGSPVHRKGAGRRAKLTLDEQIYLCLFYLRHHPTFEILGLMFEVSKTTAHDTLEFWLHALRERLPASLLEDYIDDEAAWEIVTEVLEQDQLIVDSTGKRSLRSFPLQRNNVAGCIKPLMSSTSCPKQFNPKRNKTYGKFIVPPPNLKPIKPWTVLSKAIKLNLQKPWSV